MPIYTRIDSPNLPKSNLPFPKLMERIDSKGTIAIVFLENQVERGKISGIVIKNNSDINYDLFLPETLDKDNWEDYEGDINLSNF